MSDKEAQFEDKSASFTFLHFGDPQIGMSDDGAKADGRRFLGAIREANRIRPAFILLSGDLTNRRTPSEYELLENCLRELEVPAYAVPGNHDLLSNEDMEGLAQYRQRFGEDYYHFSRGDCDFLCLNSMTLIQEGATTEKAIQEIARQWGWFEEKLREIRRREGRQIFVFMHVPPYVLTKEEPDQYFNLPLETRRRFLETVHKYEVKWILTGHTHTTVELSTPDFTLYTVGGTALILDGNGRGFRQFEVTPGQVKQTFIPV